MALSCVWVWRQGCVRRCTSSFTIVCYRRSCGHAAKANFRQRRSPTTHSTQHLNNKINNSINTLTHTLTPRYSMKETEAYASKLSEKCRRASLPVTSEDEALTIFPALNIDGKVARERLEILEQCL